MWRTVTAPVKDEDDGDQERVSLSCEWHLVSLGGHGDSRASRVVIGEPVVTCWTHNRNGLLSSGSEHPGAAAGRGEVETSLGDMLLRQRQVDK